MSYPILYKANETDFTHLGVGVLSESATAFVVEERNGIFEFEMQYPIGGALFSELKNDRLIKVDASPKLKSQRFKIIRITKPANGFVTVYGEHVSYLAQDLALKPEVSFSGTALSALNTWRMNLVDEHPFTVYSDVQTTGSGKWTIDKVENARRALGGVEGSLLDIYGGEYRFDNYHIGLYSQRGDESEALIAYGKNIMDLTQEEEIASTYTSIYPFAILRDGESEELLTLPEYFVDSEHVSKYARRKIQVVDFSQDEIDTVAKLRTRAEGYIKQNSVGVPKVNLKVKFIDLSKTLDYEHLKLVEEINLCDVVTIYFDKLDIHTQAKVIKVTWDVLAERYEEIEIGEARSSLSNAIVHTLDRKIERVQQRITTVQVAANGKNRIFRGLDQPTTGMSLNDLWYKPVGDGETELYRFDGAYWKLEKVSAGLLGGTLDAESGDLDLINVNVSTLVGNISDFVKSYWNAVNSQILIDGNAMQIINPGRGDKALIKQAGMTFLFDGIEVGRVGMNYSQQSTEAYLSFSARNGQGMNWAVETGPGTGTYDTIMEVPKGQKTLRMQKNINLNGNSILNALSLYSPQHIITDGLTTEEVGKIFADGAIMVLDALVQLNIKLNGVAKISVTDQSINLHDNLNANGHSLVNMDAVYFGTDMELRRLDAGLMDLRSQEQLRIVVNGLSMFNMVNRESGIGINVGANINMQGNDITQTSDERLKENIVDSQYDAMDFFRKIKPRNFDWIDKDRFGKQTELGLIAQELKEIEPRTVTQTPDTGMEDGMAWAINETEINKLTWIATHQLVKENDTLKQELADLKAVLSDKGLI